MSATATKQTLNGQAAESAAVQSSAPLSPWEQLRAPFPPEKVGKLPKAGCKLEEWKALPKGKCNICHGWHATSKTIHLDFIGHADVTDRLLSVDPQWNWEPAASDEHGLPLFMRTGAGVAVGLWIRLTISGVTRLGYGSVEPGSFDPEKQLIGDALRNAAMRFGVALDLWRKEDTSHKDDAPPPDAPRASTASVVETPRAVTERPAAAPPLSAVGPRAALQAALLALEGEPRMKLMRANGYRGQPIGQWIAQLDEDVVEKVAAIVKETTGDRDVDPDENPF